MNDNEPGRLDPKRSWKEMIEDPSVFIGVMAAASLLVVLAWVFSDRLTSFSPWSRRPTFAARPAEPPPAPAVAPAPAPMPAPVLVPAAPVEEPAQIAKPAAAPLPIAPPADEPTTQRAAPKPAEQSPDPNLPRRVQKVQNQLVHERMTAVKAGAAAATLGQTLDHDAAFFQRGPPEVADKAANLSATEQQNRWQAIGTLSKQTAAQISEVGKQVKRASAELKDASLGMADASTELAGARGDDKVKVCLDKAESALTKQEGIARGVDAMSSSFSRESENVQNAYGDISARWSHKGPGLTRWLQEGQSRIDKEQRLMQSLDSTLNGPGGSTR